MAFFQNKEMIIALNNVGENIFIIDTDFTIVWINDYAEGLLKTLSKWTKVRSKDELIGKNINMFHPENDSRLKEGPFPYESSIHLFNYEGTLVVNQLVIEEELKGYVLTWKGITEKKMTELDESSVVAFRDIKGSMTNTKCSREELLTEHKMTEKQLKWALEELSYIKYALDKSSFLGMLDRNFHYCFVNDAFCDLTKYSREELLGKNHSMLDSDYHSSDFYPKLFKVIERGDVWKGEIKKRAKDGSTFWVDTTIVPFLKDGEEKPYQYVTIQQDITSRKEAEEVLQRSDKLSVIGELAAGVAHEIRNPLTAIKGFAQIGLENPTYKKIVLDEIERINVIVNEFMLLAKPHAITFSMKNIIAIIKYIISMLESESNLKNVQFIFNTDDEHLIVECEENQLKQVFLNVMKNGIEAMPNGGKVFIHVQQKEDYVKITIRDQGTGIPTDKMKRLGEPFFTMKKDGNGLGLMVSYKIIQNHRGSIKVESQVDQGTTFTISLPIVHTNFL